MSVEELEETIERLLTNYQLSCGTTLAANECLSLLERQKERILESLNDYYDSL